MCEMKDCIALLQDNKAWIQKEFGVTSMSVFGSVARGTNKPDSDVDILVEMPPKILMMSALKRYLESLLSTSVDLIRCHSHLSPKFLNQISHDAITIF